MPNLASANPNTNRIKTSSTQGTGEDRGACSYYERPMSGNAVGDRIRFVDISADQFTWNGTDWVLPGLSHTSGGELLGLVKASGDVVNFPMVLAQSAVPVILAPSGTVATNGTITLGTALPVIYGGAWVYLPADAIVGGVVGLYWVVFSSETVGVVKTNYLSASLDEFIPYIPTGTLVTAVGSDVAYTQVVTEVNLVNVTVPADSMGVSGSLRNTLAVSCNSSAGDKTVRNKFGGTRYQGSLFTTSTGSKIRTSIANRGVAAKQVAYDAQEGDAGGVAGSWVHLTKNTAAAVTHLITGQLETATDYMVIEGFCIEVAAS